jgi:hypothetical protein
VLFLENLRHQKVILKITDLYYGFSAGKLNEFEVFVTNEAFFSKRAEDSDICKSFITDLGGAFVLALLMSGVMPFVILCNKRNIYIYI